MFQTILLDPVCQETVPRYTITHFIIIHLVKKYHIFL